MGTTILLVTWIVFGQRPESYQVPFSTTANCLAARDAIYAEGNRVADEFNRQPPSPPGLNLTQVGGHPPMVTAVCAIQ